MRKHATKIAAIAAALTMTATLAGCATINTNKKEEEEEIFISGQAPEETENNEPEVQLPEPEPEKPVVNVTPKQKTAVYITTTSNGVNIRSGAGTGYSVRGTAEKSTLYALDGQTGDWYKTGYKNGAAYLSSKLCEKIEMAASEDERIEAIIAEGAKLLGTAYVYGAVRYHDGKGNKLKSFTTTEFDCSSLMQYIFYKGAGKLLNMNTRTQISQGKTVTRSQLKRGDLMFFTNASRKNNTGVERVGHVALYLGGNWILHTASDYAKIEQISATRWGYFIQGQRII
ncbi:MAG: C40 family peptidase [Clostridia bacterium]|nr:C40 family peptidase [Clostridia bacterium]